MAEMACTGDCMGCNVAQRIYCAAQHCHVILTNQREILAELSELRKLLSDVGAARPLEDVTSTSDAGADSRASLKRRTSKIKKGEQDEL